MHSHHPRIAIVGGGCSGLLVAIQLIRKGLRGQITVIEPRRQLGDGLAYSTRFDQHLLNVTAAKMSALSEKPSHFLEWLRAGHSPQAEGNSFAPRKFYGEYLRDLLRETLRASDRKDFSHIQTEVGAIRIEEGGLRLDLLDGTVVHAEKAVLALGNPASSSEPERSGPDIESHWHRSPWFGDALRVRFPGERILLLGTGLTAIDSVLALKSQSIGCEVVMLSRRGILPEAHDLQAATARGAAPEQPPFLQGDNLRQLVGKLRSHVADAHRSGVPWRVVVDSLRPVTNDLWRGLSCQDRARFLRHLTPYWEPHRHRMAPELHARLQEYRAGGALRVLAGRVRGMHCLGNITFVRVQLRQGGELELEVNRGINCTGVRENYAAASRPLIRQLIDHGLARANDVGIGFQTDEHGALTGENAGPSTVLFTLGPPRRGQLFETTAVPEIRFQAEELAAYLIA